MPDPAPASTRHVENFHHIAEAGPSAGLLTVPRAGHVLAAPGYGVRRVSLEGHDVLYCLSGRGTVLIEDQVHAVTAGQLAWLPGHLPHGHGADADAPWTLLWLRLVGPAATTAWMRLVDGRRPVFDIGTGGAALGTWFQRLFALMRMRPADIALPLNALAAELLSIVEGEVKGGLAMRLPPALVRLTAAMAARPELPWSEAEMTHAAHVSGSHLRRLFNVHLSTTPRAWLRRQRILRAQELLGQRSASIGAVAEACGFSDIYHFSRDFHRIVGQPPAQWRRSEGAAGSA